MLKTLVLIIGMMMSGTPVFADQPEREDDKTEATDQSSCTICVAKGLAQGRWTDLSPAQQQALIVQATNMTGKAPAQPGEGADAIRDANRGDGKDHGGKKK